MSLIITKLGASLRKRGIIGTLRIAASYYVVPISVIPSRLAKRMSDRWWDFRHDVETSTLVDVDRLHIDAPSVMSGLRYQPTSARHFHKAIRSLAIRHDNFVFIDFGCGKGKCLLMASDYPFRKIIGVEFARELTDMARKNLENYRSWRQKCRKIEFAECEATRYPLLPEPSVYYFYNPFGANVMRQVRDRVRQSIEAHPRQVCIVYYNPVHRQLFDEAGWLRLVGESDFYCVYMNLPAG